MKMVTKVLIFLLMASAAVAQPPGYASVKDLNTFKTHFAQASAKITSIESDFVQVKNLAMIKDKMTSKGKFFYKKERKVRIDYSTPYKYLMVLNGNDMKVKDEQKTSNYNARSNKMMQSVNNVMMDCMRGTVYSNKEFVTAVFENAKDYVLVLTPSTSIMKKMFSRIEVFLDKSDYNVLRLNMVENGGDNSLMTFTNRQMNKNLDDALFSTK